MARRKSWMILQEITSRGLMGLLVAVAFLLTYSTTKSIVYAAVAAGFIVICFIIVHMFIRKRKEENAAGMDIADISIMEGSQFEQYLGYLFKAQGYSVEVIQAPSDEGTVLIIAKGGRKIVVQAKRHTSNIGIKTIQEAQAAIAHYGVAEAWVVTDSGFTEAADTLAKSNAVRLIPREQLMEMILELNPEAAIPPK
ncbi:restriction endonuclease [Paenibacillus sepulcri]|uniref:Restriction endonuclease n=1 Tax=Paenibacillus sepulcri TaxID=359917 RepID=A0ABS7CCA7_9BACL|nr:restriction endonuclease [Paenibacillus sepulcri]